MVFILWRPSARAIMNRKVIRQKPSHGRVLVRIAGGVEIIIIKLYWVVQHYWTSEGGLFKLGKSKL